MLGRIFGRSKAGSSTRGSGDGAIIELRQVVKSFELEAGTFYALKGIDLSIAAGEFVAVVGKSGSGKSTLVNMIAGIDRPSTGQVFVAGAAVHGVSENRLAEWRGVTVGVVFQFFQLLPTLTVVENIMLPMDFCNVYGARDRRPMAMALLEQVGMQDHADKLPVALSGGEQQRVAIARALANDPPILLADEPTGNLDSLTAGSVFHLFQRLVAGGKTIVMVTHDIDLARLVDRYVVLADGEIADVDLGEARQATETDARGGLAPGTTAPHEGTR